MIFMLDYNVNVFNYRFLYLLNEYIVFKTEVMVFLINSLILNVFYEVSVGCLFSIYLPSASTW